jgi:hypothetical protein
MGNQNNELELHSRISEKIYETIDNISGEVDEGAISSSTARKIIRIVRNFNFNREVLLERHKSELISRDEFNQLEIREGQRCIDEINRIMSESKVLFAV